MERRAILYRDQFRAIAETLESWKKAHDEAMGIRDVEDAIRVCLNLDQGTIRMVAEVWEAGFSGRVQKLEQIGQSVLGTLEAGLKAWQRLGEYVQTCRSLGYSVENHAAVPGALTAMKRLYDVFASRWPTFTHEELQRGRDQIARGEFVTGEDLNCALQDQDRQAS